MEGYFNENQALPPRLSDSTNLNTLLGMYARLSRANATISPSVG